MPAAEIMPAYAGYVLIGRFFIVEINNAARQDMKAVAALAAPFALPENAVFCCVTGEKGRVLMIGDREVIGQL